MTDRKEQLQHSAAYRKRIASAAWRKLRRQIIREEHFECQACHAVKLDFAAFDLHHLTYERLGRERREDLLLVCHQCHVKADAKRAAMTKQRSSNALYDARLDGWATKVYGRNWHEGHDQDEIAGEFDRWLESRGE